MIIAIHGKQFKGSFKKEIFGLFDLLIRGGHDLWLSEKYIRQIEDYSQFSHFNKYETTSDLPALDLVLSIGGDGTLLDAVSIVRDTGVPILGVNTGRLGFLSDVSLEDISDSVKALEEGKYRLDKRSLIAVECKNSKLGSFNYALNEVTIHKRDTSSMIKVEAFVNDLYLNTYWADGLIVATPTGSTAYSLSCGGPIVMPGSENLVINPIAPHNLNVRPVVIPQENTIVLRPEGRDHHMNLTIDSHSYRIDSGEEIVLRTAPFQINLVVLPGQDFFSTIRQKMMWGIDRRN